MRTIVIEGVEIPESLIAQEAQNHPDVTGGGAWSAAAHSLAVRALLLKQAQDLGLRPQPETDEAGREETPEEALIRAVLDLQVDVARPTEAECLRVYEAQPGRFRTPALYEAAHILFEPSDASDEAVASAERAAAATLAEVAARPELFEVIAKSRSACPSGQVGGSLGQMQTGDLVAEVETELSALQPGDLAEKPVRSRFGWHVLKLIRRIEGRQLPFEHVADRIALHLESRAWTAAAARYVADLAADARQAGVAVSLAPGGELGGGSFMLGALLGDGEASLRLEPWLAAVDPDLWRRVEEAATASAQTPAEFVRAEATTFAASAGDEAWTQLISAAQGADDPALAGLASILKSKLAPAPRVRTIIRRSPK